MKPTIITLAVLAIAFFGIKMFQTPTASSVQVAQKQDLTQFNTDLANYMEKVAAQDGGEIMTLVKVKANCKPNQGAYHMRCWITMTGPDGTVDKATAENVRRDGAKFVWDHES